MPIRLHRGWLWSGEMLSFSPRVDGLAGDAEVLCHLSHREVGVPYVSRDSGFHVHLFRATNQKSRIICRPLMLPRATTDAHLTRGPNVGNLRTILLITIARIKAHSCSKQRRYS
jgi:hypothetical protein